MQEFTLTQFCERSDFDIEKFNTILYQIFGDYENCDVQPWLAGGALRRLITKQDFLSGDFDFFFKSEQQRKNFEGQLIAQGFELKRSTKHAHEFHYQNFEDNKTLKVQSIFFKYYDNPEEIINSFDYTLCQLVYDGEQLYCGDYALWDIARKKLVINKITFATASVRRMIKYALQGYTVCGGAITHVLNSVAQDPTLINSSHLYID